MKLGRGGDDCDERVDHVLDEWEHVMLERVERQRAEAKKLELDVLARDARCRGQVT